MPVSLIDAKLPDFGVPANRPQLDRSIYAARLDALMKARRAASIDSLLIYADREHSANLAWLTGFDPRFEEALLVLAPGQTPTLLQLAASIARRSGRPEAEVVELLVEAKGSFEQPADAPGIDSTRIKRLEEISLQVGGVA
jgi:hypothetical protein